jgi:hypothetical protein
MTGKGQNRDGHFVKSAYCRTKWNLILTIACSSFGDNENSSSFKSLGDLGSDQIVEGIVRCLWKCNANTRNSIPSFKLPKNAVDRFRIASKISNEIKVYTVGRILKFINFYSH